MLRSHGMVRESGNAVYEKKIIKKYPELSPKFIFLHPGFNMRNNEISAVIGINQLKRLDSNNTKRKKNFLYFLQNLDPKIYKTDYNTIGNSNYALPIILKKPSIINRNILEKIMKINRIEFRRGNAGGGNQLRQPYLRPFIKNINLTDFKNVEHVHFFGYYIGNYPALQKRKIFKICELLNSLKKFI
jgi:CDP-6-deoxy-D-xylo-4-hexulose-3-dehydrase